MMKNFHLFAQPWWVNLLIVVPAATYLLLRRNVLHLAWRQLLMLTVFAAAFGFVEASVVVYLRAAIGLLPGHQTAGLAELRRISLDYQQAHSLVRPPVPSDPPGLMTIEVFREAATMFILISVALLAASRARERWACFLWAFAVWDMVYYAGLWATLGWPRSLEETDILFLIPTPWLSQVWYPLLVSSLALLAIALAKHNTARLPQTIPE